MGRRRDTPETPQTEPTALLKRPTTVWTLNRHGLIRRTDALRSGIGARELDAAVRRRELLRVGRGRYIPAERVAGLPPYQRKQTIYRARCLTAGSGGDGEFVLSHHSAAAIHGLARLSPDFGRVHFTGTGTTAGSMKNRKTAFHTGPIPDGDIAVVNGVRLTGLARTAIDVALSADFAGALAVFDAALRLGVDRDDLEQRLKAPRRGVAHARYGLRHADALAANPGESWCRAQIIEAGLPTPVLQKRYQLNDGSIAYVDLDFDGEAVLEFDGIVNYSGEFPAAAEAHPAELREPRPIRSPV